MRHQDEFRAEDLQSRSGASLRSEAAPQRGIAVDPARFPILAAWLQLPSGTLQERLNEMATRARRATAPELQQAYQLAIRVLQFLHRAQGGS